MHFPAYDFYKFVNESCTLTSDDIALFKVYVFEEY